MSRATAAKRLRFTPLALTTVLLSAGLLSLSVTGTLAGFSGAITNDSNKVTTGSLVMVEQGSTSTTCSSTSGASISTNAATCSTINDFGGPGSAAMVPGATVSQTITVKNTGSLNPSAFTVGPPAQNAACQQAAVGSPAGSALDLCSKLTLTITQDGAATPAFSGTLTQFAALTAAKPLAVAKVAAGGTSSLVLAVTLDPTADNSYQGLQATLPMTWTFTS